MIKIAKVLTKKYLECDPLKEAVQSSERLAQSMAKDIAQHAEIEKLGIEVMGDGVESDFLEFNAGIEATIGPAEKKGHLVVERFAQDGNGEC